MLRGDKDCQKCGFWNPHKGNQGTDCLAPKEWRDEHQPFTDTHCFVPIGIILVCDEREET